MKRLVTALIGILVSSYSFALTWDNKTVGNIQASYIGVDCFYFTLEGVPEADPIAPNSPWFAMPRTQFGAKEAFATLLAAKLSGKPVRIITTGGKACGNMAAVSEFTMP